MSRKIKNKTKIFLGKLREVMYRISDNEQLKQTGNG